LRTNTLVALGSAIYVVMTLELSNASDVVHTIGQVITGIGFLGAGVILHQGTEVQGLTTAATIWCSAAIEYLAGAGYLTEVLLASGIIILVNFTFRKMELWLRSREQD
jgi:putative Mg2+ transporter-C (MgtC) family protein